MTKKKIVSDDPGYLRKIVLINKESKDEKIRDIKYVNEIAINSGNHPTQRVFEGTAPTAFKYVGSDFEVARELTKFYYEGSYYEEVKEVLHPDIRVFVWEGNLIGDFKESTAISKFMKMSNN